MELSCWPPAHCEALKEYVAKGLSYSDAADAINARFGTAYSRNAALGRGRRMRLLESEQPQAPPLFGEVQLRLRRTDDDFRLLQFLRRPPVFARVEQAMPLRCVEIEPRHLGLLDLERDDCRFPYGGDRDGEAVTYCGHPRRKGSSYCAPHFHLARSPDIAAERTLSGAPLKLVDAV